VATWLSPENETEFVVNDLSVVSVPDQALTERIFPSLSVIDNMMQNLQELAPELYGAVQQAVDAATIPPEYHDAVLMFASTYLLDAGQNPANQIFPQKLIDALQIATMMCDSFRESMQGEDNPAIIDSALKLAAFTILSNRKIDSEELIELALAEARTMAAEAQQRWTPSSLLNYVINIPAANAHASTPIISQLPQGLQRAYIESMVEETVLKRWDCPAADRADLLHDVSRRVKGLLEANEVELTPANLTMLIQIAISDALHAAGNGPAPLVQNQNNANNNNNNNNNGGNNNGSNNAANNRG
jgi:hypothetical protein